MSTLLTRGLIRAAAASAVIFTVLCTSITNARAQQGTVPPDSRNFSSANWYLSVMGGEQILLKGSASGKYFVGKIHGGTWFDSWSGLRFNFQAGMKRLGMNSSSRYYSFGADYNLNLVRLFNPRSYDPESPFSFSFSAGPSMNFVRYPYHGCEYTPAVSLNIGAQMGYDFSPRWGIYAEVMSYTMERFYTPGFNLFFGFDCSIGVRFRITPHKYGHRDSDRQYYESRIEELSRRVKELERRMEKEDEDRQVIIAPETEDLSIDIYFDEFSTFISQEQRRKIDGIGQWMSENPDFNVRIIVFSDNLADRKAGERLMHGRAEVLEKLLVDKYGIDPERIESFCSEEAGYRNFTGCNARIIFLR
ncbi:MAG TPA: hypothetical protein IAC03_06440 [Candidatus Coprenecus pullistercoris]|nr:hypothetical protein [Candidatus Coprenecus pullistercoris]